MTTLAGKVALITGAGKGSGRALALAFAARSALVAANDISPVNVEEVVAEINRQGGTAKAYVEDVAKKLGAQHLISQVEDDFGRLDILIHHAAVRPRVPLLDMDEWDWNRVLGVNLTGAFLMTQSAGRVMRALSAQEGKGGGVIVHLVTTKQASTREEAAFGASMRGLAEFARRAAQELSRYGIRVHAVETGKDTVEKVFALLEEE
jgi:3-oxoacyl-[acyl-carrier protein] reductase